MAWFYNYVDSKGNEFSGSGEMVTFQGQGDSRWSNGGTYFWLFLKMETPPPKCDGFLLAKMPNYSHPTNSSRDTCRPSLRPSGQFTQDKTWKPEDFDKYPELWKAATQVPYEGLQVWWED